MGLKSVDIGLKTEGGLAWLMQGLKAGCSPIAMVIRLLWFPGLVWGMDPMIPGVLKA